MLSHCCPSELSNPNTRSAVLTLPRYMRLSGRQSPFWSGVPAPQGGRFLQASSSEHRPNKAACVTATCWSYLFLCSVPIAHKLPLHHHHFPPDPPPPPRLSDFLHFELQHTVCRAVTGKIHPECSCDRKGNLGKWRISRPDKVAMGTP